MQLLGALLDCHAPALLLAALPFAPTDAWPALYYHLGLPLTFI